MGCPMIIPVELYPIFFFPNIKSYPVLFNCFFILILRDSLLWKRRLKVWNFLFIYESWSTYLKFDNGLPLFLNLHLPSMISYL